MRNNKEPEDPKTTGLSRRDAIKFLAGAGVAGFTVVPGHVLGQTSTAPSNKINMALIGAGNRGPGVIGGFARRRDVQAVAVCDVDLSRANRCASNLGLDEKNV